MLALLVVLGGISVPRMPVDSAWAMAMATAAGALCLADGPAGMPEDGQGHEHCGICQGSAPGVGLVAVPGFHVATGGGVIRAAAVVRPAGRAAYASRAPPGGIG